MLKRIGNILLSLATGATLATVALMWASAYSAHVPPARHGWLDVLGLCFPIFAAGNATALVVWLVFRSKRAIIPLVGFICCFSDLRAYCPVNIPQPVPKGCLKFMTYNALNFGLNESASKGDSLIAADIIASDADIVCLQEGMLHSSSAAAEKRLRKAYPHFEVLDNDGAHTTLACLSRYPIIAKRDLHVESRGNAVGIFTVALDKGDTVSIINCHLQSDNLTSTDKTNYRELVKGENRFGAKNTLLGLVRKLSTAAQTRSAQVDSIKKYVIAAGDKPVIVCGDFNDSPISYPHREIASLLTDTYVASGNGPGFSYNRDGMFVRIDHLFCSAHWKPYGATVVTAAKHSDHYPICVFLKRKPK